MGFNTNLFSQLVPPLAAQSIRFGDCIFSAPELVTSNALLRLGGLESPGLYVIMAYDAQWDAVTVPAAIFWGVRQYLEPRDALAREVRAPMLHGNAAKPLPSPKPAPPLSPQRCHPLGTIHVGIEPGQSGGGPHRAASSRACSGPFGVPMPSWLYAVVNATASLKATGKPGVLD
jgi:hypothetical protein